MVDCFTALVSASCSDLSMLSLDLLSSCIFCYLSDCHLIVGKSNYRLSKISETHSEAKCIVAKNTGPSNVKVFAVNINQ